VAWLAGIAAVAIAIVIVICLNAVYAFFQEMQAVEALQAYLRQHDARVLRDRSPVTIEADAIWASVAIGIAGAVTTTDVRPV
jgi:magnesium-transporting ATPase (P-type)